MYFECLAQQFFRIPLKGTCRIALRCIQRYGWDGNAYLARKMDQVRALRGMLGDFVIDSRMEEKMEHEQHFQNYHLSPAFPASGGRDSACGTYQ